MGRVKKRKLRVKDQDRPELFQALHKYQYRKLADILQQFYNGVCMAQYAPIKSWSKQRLILLWGASRVWASEKTNPKKLRREMASVGPASGLCWVCRALEAVHRHHIVSLKRGGDNRWDNLVNLCEICHRRVHDGDQFRDRRQAEQVGQFLYVPKVKPAKEVKPRNDPNWTPHNYDLRPRLIPRITG